MTENSGDIERLRRVAYGPGASAADRAAAERALRVLAERPADVAGPVATAPVSDTEVPAAIEEGDVTGGADRGRVGDEALESVWARRIRVGWLVPIVAGALLAGVLAALASTGWFETGEPEASVGASPATTGGVPAPMPGDPEAADAWFDGQATASDAYPYSSLLEVNDIHPYEVRFVLSDGTDWNVWVGRSRTGEFCLLVNDRRDGTGKGLCVEREEFARAGVLVTGGGHFAYWTGDTVLTDRSSVGHDAQGPRNVGPGDERAALAWLATTASAADVFPYPETLPGLGIDPDEVRSVANQDPGWALWIARQGTTGYCLLATTNLRGTTFSSCVTTEEFRASGVSLVAQGHSSHWNGESVASSG